MGNDARHAHIATLLKELNNKNRGKKWSLPDAFLALGYMTFIEMDCLAPEEEGFPVESFKRTKAAIDLLLLGWQLPSPEYPYDESLKAQEPPLGK